MTDCVLLKTENLKRTYMVQNTKIEVLKGIDLSLIHISEPTRH